MEAIQMDGQALGDHCHNYHHRATRFQTCGPANTSSRRSGGASVSKSESGPSVEPRFSSYPRDDDGGEGRKNGCNRDSYDGDPSVAVGKVTAHVVGGSCPSSFVISVSTAPLTGVETSSSGSMETSWLMWFSLSGKG